MTDEPDTLEQRLFARVDARIPVRLRAVSAEEGRALARQLAVFPSLVEAPPEIPADAADASWERAALVAILARLDRLEQRLDEVLRAVDGADDGPGEWCMAETVALSGGGFGASSERRFADGTTLEVELTLAGDGAAVVRAVGRVASVLEPDGARVPVGRYCMGVAFTGIHPADREALVRYTFRVQRAQLRERRGEPGT